MTTPTAPLFLSPSAVGQLSNKRGTTQGGADDLVIKVRYVNIRSAGDPVETVRFLATKISSSGSQSTVLDTWHLGVGSFPALPQTNANAIVNTNCVFTYDAGSGSRVYICPKGNNGAVPAVPIYSAPLNGPGQGKWREETIPPNYVSTGVSTSLIRSSMVQCNGYVYVAVNIPNNGTIYYAQIQGDGTFGTWSILPGTNNPFTNGQELAAYSDTTGNYLMMFSAFATATRSAKLNADGTLVNGAWQTGGAQATAKGYCGVFFVPDASGATVGSWYLIGGYTGAVASTTGVQATLSLTGQLGAWGVIATALPAARCNFTWTKIGTQFFVVGGSSAAPDPPTPTTSIYRITLATLLSGGAFTTDAAVLGTATGGGGVGSVSPNEGTSARTTNQGLPSIFQYFTAGGAAAVTRLKINTNTGAVDSQLQAAGPSVGATLLSANLGTGGIVTANLDGSYDISYAWGAVAALGQGAAGLVDGDIVSISVQFTDSQDADVSPASFTVVKIGQPPTITNGVVSPSNNDGRPTVSWNYNAGVGGDVQLSYRMQIAPNGFDSGLRYDSANAVLVATAPYFLTGVAQTATITVTSRDSPMTGSTNQAVITPAWTPVIVAPGIPSALTAVPNHALGLIALAWTNNTPAATPGNRIYYRRNGTATWFLLSESVGSITAYNAMDQLALGVAYDFAVSEADLAIHSESALSNIVSNVKIDPVVGGYSGFLHIQGQGTVHFAPLLVQQSPDVTAVFDTTATLPFQQLTPSVTLGVAHYVKLKITQLVPTLANQKQIMDVLATAYAGNVIVYRDGFGGMITCQIDAEHTERYMPPVARESDLNLIQIPNQFQPSTAQGSATGYLQQIFNSIVPLDPSEAFL